MDRIENVGVHPNSGVPPSVGMGGTERVYGGDARTLLGRGVGRCLWGGRGLPGRLGPLKRVPHVFPSHTRVPLP